MKLKSCNSLRNQRGSSRKCQKFSVKSFFGKFFPILEFSVNSEQFTKSTTKECRIERNKKKMFNPTVLYVAAGLFVLFLFFLFVLLITRILTYYLSRRSRNGGWDVESQFEPPYEGSILPTYYELCELGLPSYMEALVLKKEENKDIMEKIIDDILILVVEYEEDDRSKNSPTKAKAGK